MECSDEMEPANGTDVMAYEEAEVAEVIERCPELASLPDWFDAAQRMLMDLDILDASGPDDIL
jgi:hypothetical protein